jgi:hypothetical protein
VSVRSKTVWKDGKLFAEYVNGKLVYLAPEYTAPKRSDLKMPMYVRDIGEYQSPVDGAMITSRSAHREHLKKHDMIEVGNDRMPTPPSNPSPSRDLGMAIKQRIEEVQALPEHVYQHQVHEQAAEHAAISSLVTAS